MSLKLELLGDCGDRARAPGQSFAPAFKLWSPEAAWFRMELKLSQPSTHRLNWNHCPWLASAKESWEEEAKHLRRSLPSRRLRGLEKRRQRLMRVFRASRIRPFLLGVSEESTVLSSDINQAR
ncbi:MAG: hypothetical protein P1V97_12080 [Planctomycetota bacterium]|nr:hypothetical protein [Planctomycetota bacterium]